MTPKSWLRISLEVYPELAEAVSKVFARYIPGGVAIESTAVQPDEREGHVVGPLRVMGYIPNDGQLERRRAQIEQGLRFLGLIQPVPEPQYQKIEDQNWMETWKQHYQPLPVGNRLLILPAWQQMDPGARIPIRIEPGMAFGTGVHPSTQLSLQLLEKYVQPGHSVIDVGCGSGILAIAAMKLGATKTVAVDTDATALENAQLNADLNQVDIEIGKGSVSELLAGRFGLRKAQVVVANILAPVLIQLLHIGLAELVEKGGILILSGILGEQAASVRGALAAVGMHVIEEKGMDEWVALVG